MADYEVDGGDRGDENHHGKRWWISAVLIPITIAVISSVTAVISKHPWSPSDSHPASSAKAAVSAAPGAAALPAADPVPAAWCFECYPHLVLVARECRDGSMSACDDLWKSIPEPKTAKQGDPAAIHDYGITCGGRRQLKATGYRYKDCVDEFPGHN